MLSIWVWYRLGHLEVHPWILKAIEVSLRGNFCYTLDIQGHLLRFGVLGMLWGSKYRTSGGVWMSMG